MNSTHAPPPPPQWVSHHGTTAAASALSDMGPSPPASGCHITYSWQSAAAAAAAAGYVQLVADEKL